MSERPHLTFRRARSRRDFAALRDDWQALHARAGARLHQSWDWLDICWRRRAPLAALGTFALLQYRDGEPVLGGAFVSGRRGFRPMLRLLASEMSQTNDLLYPPGTAPDQLLPMLAAARRTAPWCHTLDLIECRADSALVAALAAQSPTFVQRGATTGVYLDLSRHADFDSWLAERSQNLRYYFRRRSRNLIQSDRLRFAPQTGSRAREALDWLLARKKVWLGERGHQSDWLTGGFAKDAFHTLLASPMTTLRPKIYALRTPDDAIVAANFSVVGGKTLHMVMIGHDPSWERDGPGIHLQMLVVREAFAEGLSVVELGPGTLGWKQRLSDHHYQLVYGRGALPAAPYPPVRFI